tara:strand:+ start:4899 stop:5153 length:255 start_codon:yes stop_codon:yes gene_type:complete
MENTENKKEQDKIESTKNGVLQNISGSSLRDCLDYEIRSSWWASWIFFEWGQEISGAYFAWKTKRKYNRYIKTIQRQLRLRNYR